MSSYKRRVDALEQATRILNLEQTIESDLHAMWPEVERLAAQLEITPEAFADEVRAGLRRRAQIGTEAYDREQAEELGLTLKQVRDPDFLRAWNDQKQREYDEWRERRAAEQAKRVTWCAGVKCIGGVPQYDEAGQPIMFSAAMAF